MRVYIKKSVVETILYISKNIFPKEFIGLLSGKINNDNIYISKLIIPSGVTSGNGFASYILHRTPYNTIGTVHSHPNIPKPSLQDLNLFSYSGKIHIIVGRPFSLNDIKVYDNKGNEIKDVIIYDEEDLRKFERDDYEGSNVI